MRARDLTKTDQSKPGALSTPKNSNALEQATAADQIAGFVYQINRALEALFNLQEGQSLGVEIADDYHTEDASGIKSLSQLKLHQVTSSLTDGSKDLWKTLGIWARATLDGSLDLNGISELRLITTANLPTDSIAAKIVGRDTPSQIAINVLTVEKSKDVKLARDFDAVHRLSNDKLELLISRIRIEANALNLAESQQSLQKRLRLCGFHETSIPDALYALLGWFNSRILSAFSQRKGALISESDFHSALSDIRDRFTKSALPVRYSNTQLQDAEFAGQRKSIFVRQLEFVGVNEEQTHRAIRDYLRAIGERTTWLEQTEVLPDELEMFDQELKERWEPLHDQCCSRTVNADENTCRSEGLKHYFEIQNIVIRINERWPSVAYLTRGSYHYLANLSQLGWHPRWGELLQKFGAVMTSQSISKSRNLGVLPKGSSKANKITKRTKKSSMKDHR